MNSRSVISKSTLAGTPSKRRSCSRSCSRVTTHCPMCSPLSESLPPRKTASGIRSTSSSPGRRCCSPASRLSASNARRSSPVETHSVPARSSVSASRPRSSRSGGWPWRSRAAHRRWRCLASDWYSAAPGAASNRNGLSAPASEAHVRRVVANHDVQRAPIAPRLPAGLALFELIAHRRGRRPRVPGIRDGDFNPRVVVDRRGHG